MHASSQFLLTNSSRKPFSSSESVSRSQLHTLSTNNWLKSRYNKTTNLNYLCFPSEKQQYHMNSQVFSLLTAENPEKLQISSLISAITRYNCEIPRRLLFDLLKKHDFDQDNALNFEEFKSCALSVQGKLIFSQLLSKLKRKTKTNSKKHKGFPDSFNSLITQVSYQSEREELLGKVKDVSLEINRRANNFFKLFTLRTKYKKTEDYEGFGKKVAKKQETYEENSGNIEKNKRICEKNRGNASYCSEEDEICEEIGKIVEKSKKKGCEEVESLCRGVFEGESFEKGEKVEVLEEKTAENCNFVEKQQRNYREITKKNKKMEKIMEENLRISRKNKATRLFRDLIGFTKETQEKRQIKFYPIQINKKAKRIEEYKENDEKKTFSSIKEFEVFLPKIEELKERPTLMKKISKFPTLNIFDEDFNVNSSKKKKKYFYFNED